MIKIKENEQTKTSRLSILKLRNKSRHNRRRIKLLRTYEICGVKTTLEEEDLGRSTGYVERGRGVYRCYGDPRTCSDMYAVNSASLSVNTGSSPNYVIGLYMLINEVKKSFGSDSVEHCRIQVKTFKMLFKSTNHTRLNVIIPKKLVHDLSTRVPEAELNQSERFRERR